MRHLLEEKKRYGYQAYWLLSCEFSSAILN